MDQAQRVASIIIKGFRRHFSLFQAITAKAKQRFELADWNAYQQDSSQRISFYDQRVNETLVLLKQHFPTDCLDQALWHQVKQHYIDYLRFHPQAELAETFYNSVFCKLFSRQYFHNDNIFVESTLNKQALPAPIASVYQSYFPAQDGLKATLLQIIASFNFATPFINLDRDIRLVVQQFIAQSSHGKWTIHHIRFDILTSIFFRNKAAYIVGRAVTPDGQQPFIIPVLHNEQQGLFIDTLLTDPMQMTIVFGFSRAYFMVACQVPSALVHFLRELLPNKTLAELYACIGLHKQGKTEFYRELLYYLQQSNDKFVVAPGTRGMVMMVFTLPSFPYVFKVIRDKFAPSKEFGRDTVKARYLLVKKHDRVGRMADTLEYSDVALPKNRFSTDLLQELTQSIAGSIKIENDLVIIKHLYIERRMQPLNLYLEQASDAEQTVIMDDYGKAIKEMIAANIFPGDMLLKNFGVTRHNRVVFYDYDEVQYMLDVNFRAFPKTDNYEDAMFAEGTVCAAPGDVFPEQMATFVTPQAKISQLLFSKHPELLEASYWKSKQANIRQGKIEDIYPYPDNMRFYHQY
ncbi:bifunctional isocitrate dehydrogenase kinase/phosphatase [Rheinheimera sp. WS51]|uniref:bifunctional isocitrate dehydrogenase kinase/phosphatase n=1 Tax=Rheinheimera sp. WS51 TaxID=3425886 RepID=UPI003D90C113